MAQWVRSSNWSQAVGDHSGPGDALEQPSVKNVL
jgi:hypothetical protein